MIYEFRTYSVQPHSLATVVERFGAAYETRRKYSELAAFWYTEIGPLNEIIHVWPYENLEARARIRAAAAADADWPPPIAEFLVAMQSEIFIPFPFTPVLQPGRFGPVWEMRSYILKPGAIDDTITRWGAAFEPRSRLSPLAIALYSELGALNKFVHIWPYESLDARRDIRAEARAQGIWPPPGGRGTLVSQENKIMLPAPFSPVQ
jgi:NIPSNAP